MSPVVSNNLAKLLKPVVEIRPGERMKTLIMFFYFFSIIATIWMLKPVRNSLFLDELGAKNLRYVYMGEGLFLIGVVWAFVQFSKRVNKKTLYNGVLLFFIFCLIGFWFLFQMSIPFLSAFFYVWAASYSIIMTTQFFTLANDIFNPLEAKRLFGLILSGGSIGGVLGGIATRQLVGVVGTENLLLVIAAIIGGCNLLVMTNWKHLIPKKTINSDGGQQEGAEEKDNSASSKLSGRKLLMGSSYLVMLLALIMIVKMSSAVVDNQFNATVEAAISGKDQLTAFYGGFFSFLNALSFIMQLFVTSLIFRYLGVGIALWILPVGLMLGSGAATIFPVLLTGIILKSFDGSTNYSIQQATKEVLYLPVPSDVRYKVKPVIDMLGYRIAKSLGGVYIAIAAPLFGIADQKLGILVLCLIPIWFFLAWRMRAGYSQMLRTNLINQDKLSKATEPHRATDVLATLYSEKTIESLKDFLSHRSPYARKLSSSAYLLCKQVGSEYESARKIMEQIVKHEAIELNAGSGSESDFNSKDREAIRVLEDMIVEGTRKKQEGGGDSVINEYPKDVMMKIEGILNGDDKGLAIKRRAIGLLEMVPRQEAVVLLMAALQHANDNALRFVILKALNHVHDQKPNLQIDRALIKNEIEKEAAVYTKILKLYCYCCSQKSETTQENYLEIILKAMEAESFERIFSCLELLYPNEIINIIHNRIINHPPEDPIRAHAIELLNTTLERDILSIVYPIMEGLRTKKVNEVHAVEILKEFAQSKDPWFYLLSVFYIADNKLEEKWPELLELTGRSEFQLFDKN